ncbi:MAG: DoxX family protein [Gammaproteobacteria bacterium]|jgi:putative oxidoreductase|nr:DoxX family protein [Gammaproteobacteria bacterium]
MITLLRNDAAGKLVLRLTVGLLMLFHGIGKLLHPGSLDFIGSNLAGMGLPEIISWGVYVGEVIAPLMIILGIQARLGGLLIVINMLFAIGLVHMGDIFALTEHGGWRLELQGFYLFGALAIMLLGSGRYAVKPD